MPEFPTGEKMETKKSHGWCVWPHNLGIYACLRVSEKLRDKICVGSIIVQLWRHAAGIPGSLSWKKTSQLCACASDFIAASSLLDWLRTSEKSEAEHCREKPEQLC